MSARNGSSILLLACLALAGGLLKGASGAPPTRSPLPTQVREADDYFKGRQNLANVSRGIALLRGAVAVNPQDYESWWRLAKFYNFSARHAPYSEKMKLLRQGVEAGRKAAGLRPSGVEGHFWLGVNYGLMAEDGGLIEGLRLIDTIRHEMQAVMKLDADYEDGSALRNLARVDYRAPFFKGGDKRRSIQLLEECQKKYPDDSFTMLYLADSYLAVGRRAEARDLLERILKLCPDPDYGPELADNQAEARAALSKNFRTGK